MEEKVFLNGKFVPAQEAAISLLSPGFLLGRGLFETMRSFRNKIIYFEAHLKRILNSAKLADIKSPYPAAKLKTFINEAVEINGFKDSYVRLTLSKSEKGTDTSVIVKKYQPHRLSKYRQGFCVCVCNFRQDENSLYPRLKTTSRFFHEMELREAKKKGFDEGLILNNSGCIAECTRSNIFLIKNKTLFTPQLSCGCLDGVTRRVILDLAAKYKIKPIEGNFTIQELYNADEAFLTNSLMGVMPLAACEKEKIVKIGKGKSGLTEFFREKYNSMLK